MRPAQQTAATVLDWVREGRRVASGLLVAVDGSAPLDVGASMYVDEAGRVEGSLTGGCVEGAVAQEALELLETGAAPLLVTYGISDELAGTVGLMCGGTVHIFVHVLAAGAMDAAARGLRALVDDHPSSVATLLDGAHAGAKMYVDATSRVGTLGGPDLLDRNVEREARGLIAHGRTTVRHFGEDGTTLGTGLRVHMRTHAEPPRMIIFGAIDFSAALAAIAGGLGYRVTIADPRTAFLDSARFTAGAETVAAWPDEVLHDTRLGPRDAVLVFTHDAKLDVPALTAAFATDAGYIGALGSRRTATERERRLRAAGATDQDLARLHAPCGLDIGAATVEETAIAVLAEMTAHRAGRTGAPLSEGTGPIRRERTGEPELAAPMPADSAPS
jgi:xanthine dehydrogenase accessory factor